MFQIPKTFGIIFMLNNFGSAKFFYPNFEFWSTLNKDFDTQILNEFLSAFYSLKSAQGNSLKHPKRIFDLWFENV